jgi:hypothetical protein
MVQDSTDVVDAQDEQLDARLAELLRIMHRKHLDVQEVQAVS